MLEGREVQAYYSGFLDFYRGSEIKIDSEDGDITINLGIGSLSIRLIPAKARELAEGLIRELNRMELAAQVKP
jgi:hypothetical protein